MNDRVKNIYINLFYIILMLCNTQSPMIIFDKLGSCQVKQSRQIVQAVDTS